MTAAQRRRSNLPVSPLSSRQWTFLWTVAERVVPETSRLDPEGRERFEAIVGKALADRPPSVRRQFGLFLRLVRWAPLLRFGAPFHRLAPGRRDAVLRWLMDAPVARLRGGFWGLRALVFMGYYGRPEAWPEVRYTPSFDGNERLHG